MSYAYALALTFLNALFWCSIVFGIPGTWLMVLSAALVHWLNPSLLMFSWITLGLAAGLAAFGEILEFTLSAAGSRHAGGSKRAAVLAIVGALVGGVVGTVLAVPIVGTLAGACTGAFAGSLLGDLWAGRTMFQSLLAGKGAVVGRLWGTIVKLGLGAAIFALLAVAAFV